MEAVVFGAWFLASWCAGILAHEFGHATAAWALGYYVGRIIIGCGPSIVKIPLGSTASLTLNAIMVVGGSIQALHPDPPNRLRHIFYVLGGVSMNMIMAGIFVVMSSQGLATTTTSKPVILAQLLLIAAALFPMQMRAPEVGVIASDGRQLLQALFRWKPHDPLLPQRILTYIDEKAACLPVPPLPPDAVTELARQLGRADGHSDPVARREIVDCLLDLVSTGRIAGPLEGAALDAVVDYELVLGGTGLVPASLDSYSARAVELLPIPCVRATRGGVLVVLGQLDAGTALLKDALDADDRFHMAVLCRAFLGLAAFKRGDRKASRDNILEARDLIKRHHDIKAASQMDRRLSHIEASHMPIDADTGTLTTHVNSIQI